MTSAAHPPPAIDEFLRAGLNITPVRRHASGMEADVWEVRRTTQHSSPAQRGIMLKIFHPEVLRRRPQLPHTEMQALRALSLALRTVDGVVCPEPLIATASGYAMTEVDGRALSDLPAPVVKAFRKSQAPATLIGALVSFHHASGEIYGDFHAGNIMVARDQLALVDPGPARPALFSGIRSVPEDLLAADLAYWLFSERSRAVRRILRTPRSTLARLGVAETLIDAAIGGGFLASRGTVDDWCSTYFDRLRARGDLRSRAVAAVGKRITYRQIGRWLDA